MILFHICGAWYYMADIGLRMLTPRELYRANGFPSDYTIERDYTGPAYGKSKQVARCRDGKINTMRELEEIVAV